MQSRNQYFKVKTKKGKNQIPDEYCLQSQASSDNRHVISDLYSHAPSKSHVHCHLPVQPVFWLSVSPVPEKEHPVSTYFLHFE